MLVEKQSGSTGELFLYETASATFRALFSVVRERVSTSRRISARSIYLAGGLYRYDISSGTLSFIDETLAERTGGDVQSPEIGEVSADGQQVYFAAEGVGGVPGGSQDGTRDGTKAVKITT